MYLLWIDELNKMKGTNKQIDVCAFKYMNDFFFTLLITLWIFLWDDLFLILFQTNDLVIARMSSVFDVDFKNKTARVSAKW